MYSKSRFYLNPALIKRKFILTKGLNKHFLPHVLSFGCLSVSVWQPEYLSILHVIHLLSKIAVWILTKLDTMYVWVNKIREDNNRG